MQIDISEHWHKIFEILDYAGNQLLREEKKFIDVFTLFLFFKIVPLRIRS